ncbi:MAG: hypothetical protein COV74_02770 [Candidatus Omnitrophica bacterium CG11_big_fil_rev_8_21_14_0_20_45_26]|uniref:Type 4a pilus biogenesis protein PilO n=1 Tax=Candidatus Abzuiibacterium crystallinum TaxID=1974748 RepID=A0A2H0LTY8_9BACT|nr:MAG: hypothetical protein COV74_02770 [Candidatus Omnitrophica bacterium CG11_big_fil_rev_8_21_14_0_20_45_26]PIW65555.1 MAG: hypothetical protein COW12_01150 [Candidatus Omnitrophica bacterium CG12_big_fil_rev_8_21_14_0_65_45_16]
MAVRPESQKIVLQWAVKEKVVLHLSVLAGLIVFAAFAVIGPRIADLNKQKAKLKEFNSFLLGTQEAAKRLRNLEQLLADQRQALKELNAQTLKRTSIAAMLQNFTAASESLPMTILDIRPDEAPAVNDPKAVVPAWKENGFDQKLLNIHFQCRYQTLGRLLERLEETPLIYHVTKLEMGTKDLIAPNLDISLTLASYVENSPH